MVEENIIELNEIEYFVVDNLTIQDIFMRVEIENEANYRLLNDRISYEDDPIIYLATEDGYGTCFYTFPNAKLLFLKYRVEKEGE